MLEGWPRVIFGFVDCISGIPGGDSRKHQQHHQKRIQTRRTSPTANQNCETDSTAVPGNALESGVHSRCSTRSLLYATPRFHHCCNHQGEAVSCTRYAKWKGVSHTLNTTESSLRNPLGGTPASLQPFPSLHADIFPADIK